MKLKTKLLLLIGLLQPLSWWFTDCVLTDFAKKHNSGLGLDLVCFISAVLFGGIIILSAFRGWEEEEELLAKQ